MSGCFFCPPFFVSFPLSLWFFFFFFFFWVTAWCVVVTNPPRPPLAGSQCAGLFSTTVLGGSSSAPNLQDYARAHRKKFSSGSLSYKDGMCSRWRSCTGRQQIRVSHTYCSHVQGPKADRALNEYRYLSSARILDYIVPGGKSENLGTSCLHSCHTLNLDSTSTWSNTEFYHLFLFFFTPLSSTFNFTSWFILKLSSWLELR